MYNNTCLTRGATNIQQEYEKHRAHKYREGGGGPGTHHNKLSFSH